MSNNRFIQWLTRTKLGFLPGFNFILAKDLLGIRQ